MPAREGNAARRPARPGAAHATRDSLFGFSCAFAAYGLWAFLALYMKAVAHMSPVEVIAHRMVWSLPIALLALLWLRQTAALARALGDPRTLLMAGVAAALVSINWGIYVWAIGSGHALDAALGYYINPLFSIILGAVLLQERVVAAQWTAIALAALGVGVLAWRMGSIPVAAIGLTFTWGLYAFCKSTLPVGANEGFALEVLLLLPVGAGLILWYGGTGGGHFLAGSLSDTLLLLGCGPITAVPLLFYANGAKRLRLITLSLMQYIVPTGVFLIAVFIFREPFTATDLLAFGFIWAGLVLYSLSQIRLERRVRAGDGAEGA